MIYPNGDMYLNVLLNLLVLKAILLITKHMGTVHIYHMKRSFLVSKFAFIKTLLGFWVNNELNGYGIEEYSNGLKK